MHDYYLVNHGKNGILGSFAAQDSFSLRRGDQVIVESLRGLEVGAVLGPASVRQSRLLGGHAPGVLVRPVNSADRSVIQALKNREQDLFAAAQAYAADLVPAMVLLDAELLYDGRHAFLQMLGGVDLDPSALVERLQQECQVLIKLENLAIAAAVAEEEDGGCGKPDCGKTEGGGCSTCSTGGGCSSCGSAKTDLRPYFAHLRAGMEDNARTALL